MSPGFTQFGRALWFAWRNRLGWLFIQQVSLSPSVGQIDELDSNKYHLIERSISARLTHVTPPTRPSSREVSVLLSSTGSLQRFRITEYTPDRALLADDAHAHAEQARHQALRRHVHHVRRQDLRHVDQAGHVGHQGRVRHAVVSADDRLLAVRTVFVHERTISTVVYAASTIPTATSQCASTAAAEQCKVEEENQ